ncbi:MAG: RES family NAD+ phosphorylase [Candidatus Hydrogenedentes bacterium]|nr:RES family NAD+ phosphorylase [Candidatus Hydrogenedentota bacterium]
MLPKCCCPECFDDRGLREKIFPTLKPEFGTCSYCGSVKVQLVEPGALRNLFEILTNVYESDGEGKTLVEWMKEDWRLFPDDRLDVAHAKELLAEILDDGEIVRRSFSPSSAYRSVGLLQWDAFRDELMTRNRWFLDETLDIDRLRELLSHVLIRGLSDRWYRARVCKGGDDFPLSKMGAPPNQLASHGRANPAGIPYLYLGSDAVTAVAEVRPHTGDRVCVAEFEVPGVVAVDLRDPRKCVSPFFLAGADEIGQLRADLPLLERLGAELTRPVLPDSAAIDYIPSQYLCEFIKKCGFDGVVYGSSVSDGINLALFDPVRATPKSSEYYHVTKVAIETVRA